MPRDKYRLLDAIRSKSIINNQLLVDCFISLYKLIEENEHIRQVHSSVQEELAILRYIKYISKFNSQNQI